MMPREVFVMKMRKAGSSSWGRRKDVCCGRIILYDQYDRKVKSWKYANIYYFQYRMRIIENKCKAVGGYYVVVSPTLEIIKPLATS
jgi:hypothetical protein